MSHILLRSREDAERVRSEIVANGGDRTAFINAAREHSLDPVTKIQGGDLLWISRRSNMDAEFTKAAFDLPVGEISQPVKSSFGWHLIYLRDRRGEPDPATAARPGQATGDPDAIIPEHDHGDHAGHDHGAEPLPPPVKAIGKRRTLSGQLILSIESARAQRAARGANQFVPEAAVELDLVLRNKANAVRKVPHPSLLVLGFDLVEHASKDIVRPDFSELARPEEIFITLEPYEIAGTEVSLNDWFKDLEAVGRFDLSWSARTFFRNLEALYTDVASTSDYQATKTSLTDVASAVVVDQVRRDHLPHWGRASGYTFSILPVIRPGDRLFARIQVQGEREPVMIELETERQRLAVDHFASLALDGFYDNLSFHDVQAGEYVITGSPLPQGTGAPAMSLPQITNSANIPHERGTVSFVSRSIRTQGPARGGQVGSIFFVTLKPRPEWDSMHVPFGKVVEGIEVLERARQGSRIQSVTILPASEYGPPAETTRPSPTQPQTRLDPEIVVKTSKGDLRITLFETAAPNTVSSFITLAESGFFSGAVSGEKMKFFHAIKDTAGKKVALQAGSPTNDTSGEGAYHLRDEINPNRCVKGALVMAKKWDPALGSYVANSASTQFFICVEPIPAYDAEGAFTVFGSVAGESFGVLDQLDEGDEIVGVEIVRKSNRPYANFQRL